MKYLKCAGNTLGNEIVPQDRFVRYVRADLFDEIIINWNGMEEEEAIYTVEGVVYENDKKDELADDFRHYDIAYFDTFAEADKFLENLVADLNRGCRI